MQMRTQLSTYDVNGTSRPPARHTKINSRHPLGICRSIAGHPLGIGRTLTDNKYIVHAL